MKNLLIILFISITGSTYSQKSDSLFVDDNTIIYKTTPIEKDSLIPSDGNIFSLEEKEDDKERIVTIKIDRILFKKRFREKKASIKRAFKIHKESIKKTREEMKNGETKNIIIEIDDEVDRIDIEIEND